MNSPASRHPAILVIEDDAAQRWAVCEALRAFYGGRHGGQFVPAATAAEALAQDIARFDIVLQDYYLPDMDGMELLERLLAAADVPVVVVTGHNDYTTAVEAIRRGALDYVVKLGDYLLALPVVMEKNIRQHQWKMENRRLQLDLQAMLEEVQVKNVQLTESMQKLRQMAVTDDLTRLANRRHFAEAGERLFAQALRYGFDLTCCMCDLDGFKRVNDSLGHQAGDELLRTTAGALRGALRDSDLAARYGGDEFVLLLPHTSIDRGRTVAKRIRDDLAAALRGRRPPANEVTLAIGLSSLVSEGSRTADEMVALADRALYAAKVRGRGQIVSSASLRIPAAG
jgi:diguanylate cyclase (GGDEF)-like protein